MIETDQVKDCRRIHDDNFKTNGRRFLLIYTAPKFSAERVRTHIRDVCGNETAEVRIYLESHPTEGERMYALVDVHKRFQSIVSRVFDVNRNHPITFAVRCKTDWYSILACFPEDNDELECHSEEDEAVPAPLGVSDMKYWQVDVLALMKSNISVMKASTTKGKQLKDCKINMVVTRPKCGRSSLVSALKRAKPTSVHVIEGIVDMEELGDLKRIPVKMWDRQTLIVNIGCTSDIERLRAMYVFIDGLLTRTCWDIWFFSSLLCQVTQDENGKVAVYGVDYADWANSKVGQLIPRRLPRSRRIS